ncbi:MAG: FAD-dependent oxidoreductase [Granulosicoccus sp.]
MTSPTTIEIIGSGVTGLCCAILFAQRGCEVTIRSASNGGDETCCSWWAGGMLAPWCEMETSEPLISKLGVESIAFWQKHCDGVVNNGSLVLASRRELPDLELFASRTINYERLLSDDIASMEPDLGGRFEEGLYFADECHLDPRDALQQLLHTLSLMSSVRLDFSNELDVQQLSAASSFDWRIDCRGLSARDVLTDLRGVRGEMLILKTKNISLKRPIRLLHPRYPIYVVPRTENQFMIGATMIESDHRGDPSVRSIMELLSTAYALHPIFAEASVVEMGADARPAYIDNLPRLRRRENTLYLNGLFRHGYLCAPAMAQRTVELALDDKVDAEVVDENYA